MESTRNDRFIPQSSSTELSTEEEVIINKTLLTHEGDDGHRVDCKILFQAMESVMFYASKHTSWVNANQVRVQLKAITYQFKQKCLFQAVDMQTLDSIENLDSKETLRHTILKMSRAIQCECHDTADIHTRTLLLLEMLGNYRWDAKVVLILTAFSISYGEFRLILEVHLHNPLAASLAALKNLCGRNLDGLRPQFKAMEMVVKEMMELAKCVVRFEGLPLQEIGFMMIMIIYRNIFFFFFFCRNSSITANAAWGLSSLALRLSRLCSYLRMQVDAFQDQIEQKVYRKLMNLVKDETQVDNQEVLHLFFSLNDDLPLKDFLLKQRTESFPFSNSREKELWELEERWNLQLMFDGIDHFLTKTMVEAGENICVCGSSNLDWINEFESRIKKLRNVGLQLRVIYVGSRNASENTRTTLTVMNKDNSLTPPKIRLFWLRLERIRDSLLRVGQIQTFANYETLLNQVLELLETDDRKDNWAIFGCGSSKDFVKLEGNKIMELFDRFPVWGERVTRFGFVDAIKSVDDEIDLTATCDHTTVVPYDEGMVRGTMVCDKCKRTMKSYLGYQ
ncbi:hypothetical protein OSB04_022052 [Centaurea solstitialis]|uniref:Uncharacterized protein n=1 Tax=Centaurea solstitialis TaxID=347529 RepID=A0AA38SVD4_9ASTR|nr:hypothetical protein OSB04_022052 [Centaurea solstitialis]